MTQMLQIDARPLLAIEWFSDDLCIWDAGEFIKERERNFVLKKRKAFDWIFGYERNCR
jgi:hypothetical protein